MGHEVPAEAAPVAEGLPTLGAVVGLLSSVSPLMAGQRRVVKEGLPAVPARLISLFSGHSFVWG